jgi:hypothetical protein
MLFLFVILPHSAILWVMRRRAQLVVTLFSSGLRTRLSLQLGIAALRHQLSV